jgi:hypothetical protein
MFRIIFKHITVNWKGGVLTDICTEAVLIFADLILKCRIFLYVQTVPYEICRH